jgi:hypothetical protein
METTELGGQNGSVPQLSVISRRAPQGQSSVPHKYYSNFYKMAARTRKEMITSFIIPYPDQRTK